MADIRASVAVLEDSATQAGLPLHKALAGEASASKNAHGAFTLTDAAGNFQYGKVNANREQIVTLESADLANLNDTAAAVAGSTAAFQSVVTIPLVPGAVYRNFSVVLGCTRDSLGRIILNDDGTPVDVANGLDIVNGKTFSENLEKLEITAGATGTQSLILQGKNLNTVSDFRGTLAVEEVQI